MVLEIWKAISEGGKEYYFIIDTINFFVYMRHPGAGVTFFISKKEAEKELKKIKRVLKCFQNQKWKKPQKTNGG